MKHRQIFSWLLAVILLLAGCAASSEQPSGSANDPISIRTPSESPMKSLTEPDSMRPAIASPAEYRIDGTLRAGMVPHHLVASDMIAGFFSMAAQNGDYDAVLLLSPSHFPENCNSDLVTVTADWSTPYGTVKTDLPLTTTLLEHTFLAVENNRSAVEADHGVSGLVPFIRYYLPDTPVAVCLISNRLPVDRLDELYRVVARLCQERNILLVSSLDCSHYLEPDQAAERDIQTIAAIDNFDLERIAGFTDSNVDSPQALSAMLYTAQELECALIQLDHASSADKLPHDISNPIYQEGITTYLVYAAYH